MPDLNIDSTYGVIVIQDMEPVYVDENYARIYGYQSGDELLSSIDSFLDLIDPEWHQNARDNYALLVSGNKIPRGKTYKNVDRSGRHFTVFTLEHVIEWQGKPAVKITVIDLSLLEQAHQRIRDNERKYKRLVTHSGQGIMIHRNFKPIMVNQAWVDLMHAPSVEYVLDNVSLFDFIPKEVHSQARSQYESIMSAEVEGFHQIVENVCFNGERRYFNVYDNLIEWDGEPAMQAVIEDVTDRIKLERELHYKAHHDHLTGLYNREAIYKWLDDAIEKYDSLACLLVDVDDFKSVNDSYGHFSGDELIQMLASTCQSVVGEHGVVARWGGEEFIVFLPAITESKTLEIANRLRSQCEQAHCMVEQKKLSRTISIGVAYQDQLHLNSLGEVTESRKVPINALIRNADKNLYAAKAKGKNRVEH